MATILIPEEKLDPKHPFIRLFKEIWWSLDPYLSDADRLALALTCKAGAYRVNQLKKGPNLGRYLTEAQQQPLDEIELKPFHDGLNWRLIDMALPVDGLWLFVAHQYDTSIWLDIYRRDSLLPLKFHHEERVLFKAHLSAGQKFIVGLDNNKKKPGIFFVDSEFEIFSYHLGNPAPTRLRLPPNFLDDLTSPCAVHGNGENVTVYRQSPRAVNEVTMDRDGNILKSRDYVLTNTDPNSLTLSPNGRCLLVFCENFTIMRVYDTHSVNVLLLKSCNMPGLPLLKASITDDARTIFVNDQILPIDRTFVNLTIDNPKRTLGDDPLIVAHSGNGRIALTTTQSGKVCQLVLEQSPYSAVVMDAINWVLTSISYDHHVGDVIRRTTVGESAYNATFHQNLEIIRQHIPAFDVSAIAKLAIVYGAQRVGKLYIVANCLWVMNMRELAAKPEAPQRPLFATRQALAKSPLVHDQSNIMNRDVPVPMSSHKTADVGVVNSHLFRRTGGHEHGTFNLAQQYISMKAGSEKQALFSSLQNILKFHRTEADLIDCAIEIKPDFRIADAFCLSKNPRADRLVKKLIPKRFARSLRDNSSMRHYINFDAVLIKLISWMSDGKQKNDLEAARLRMMQAVKINPSLHYDLNQLWDTSFFGEPSIDSCLKDPIYRRQIIRSFHIDKHYAFELVHSPRAL